VEFAGFKLAGLIPSPQSLAEATLSPEEKKAGCLFINFGAGMTSAVVYKGGAMVYLSMIPLGGHVITKDLMKILELKEPDAEWLKTRYGLMLAGKDKGTSDTFGQTEIGGKVIALKKMNAIIEARTKEIVENIYAQVERVVSKPASLAAGIILAGGASNLNSLPELLRQRFNLEVRYAAIRREWLHIHENKAGNPDYITAISLLIAGTENCLSYVPPPPLLPESPVESELLDEPESEPLDRKKAGGLLGSLFGSQDRKDDGKKDTTRKPQEGLRKLMDNVNKNVNKILDAE
jgi:cell division protein FtsA